MKKTIIILMIFILLVSIIEVSAKFKHEKNYDWKNFFNRNQNICERFFGGQLVTKCTAEVPPSCITSCLMPLTKLNPIPMCEKWKNEK